MSSLSSCFRIRVFPTMWWWVSCLLVFVLGFSRKCNEFLVLLFSCSGVTKNVMSFFASCFRAECSRKCDEFLVLWFSCSVFPRMWWVSCILVFFFGCFQECDKFLVFLFSCAGVAENVMSFLHTNNKMNRNCRVHFYFENNSANIFIALKYYLRTRWKSSQKFNWQVNYYSDYSTIQTALIEINQLKRHNATIMKNDTDTL